MSCRRSWPIVGQRSGEVPAWLPFAARIRRPAHEKGTPGSRGNRVRHRVGILVALWMLALAAACAGSDQALTVPTDTLRPADSPAPAGTVDTETGGSTPACPPARGQGTVSPAVSIYSITFVVNGVEQVVRDNDVLGASPGDQVSVQKVTICTGSFQGNGGEACVDLAPVDQRGEEVVSEHVGTHMAPVIRGFMSVPGPEQTWTIDEAWRAISAVLNHWPPGDTQDRACGGGRCECDDRIVVRFR
jgi:hypothetical protein